jgi:hypothetical protein
MRRAFVSLVLLLMVFAVPVAADEEKKLPQEELDKLMAATDEIARTVSEQRKLPIKRPIARGVMSKPDILARLVQRIDEDYAPAEIVAEQLALKRLGLLPRDADYRRMVLDLLTEQVVGFYDPQVRELYIADWADPGMQRLVMAHEIGHALQDQSFDLKRFTRPNRENGDEQLAHQALVEGDGVALMIEFMFREMGQKADPWADDTIVNAMSATAGVAGGALFDKAPLFLRETLLFPYTGGVRFIAASRRTRPWSAIDAMFARPPASTEQVLHPTKYDANEKPVVVKATTPPSLRRWKKLYTNVVGELLFSVFLREHGARRADADRAAAGWGGDRLQLFGPSESPELDDVVLIDCSFWDSETDAAEAEEALAAALREGSFDDAEGKTSSVERRGKRVLLVIGQPAALPRLRDEIWKTWR